MKPVVAAFALLALAAPASAATQESETVTRTIAMPAGGTLDLKTFSGHVTITSTDGNDVTVRAVRRGTRRRLDRTHLEVRSSGSIIYVDANQHDSSSWTDTVVDNDLEVQVPRRTNLRLSSFSAPIEVEGVDAADIEAHTFSGQVELRLDRWQDHQRIDIKTFSGRVALRIPENARAHVDYNSFSGRLDSDLPLTLHSSSRRNLSAELGSSEHAGELRIHTFSGGVKITR